MWKKKQEKKRDEWMERKESEWERKKKRKEGWNVGIKEFKRKDRERERNDEWIKLKMIYVLKKIGNGFL